MYSYATIYSKFKSWLTLSFYYHRKSYHHQKQLPLLLNQHPTKNITKLPTPIKQLPSPRYIGSITNNNIINNTNQLSSSNLLANNTTTITNGNDIDQQLSFKDSNEINETLVWKVRFSAYNGVDLFLYK